MDTFTIGPANYSLGRSATEQTTQDPFTRLIQARSRMRLLVWKMRAGLHHCQPEVQTALNRAAHILDTFITHHAQRTTTLVPLSISANVLNAAARSTDHDQNLKMQLIQVADNLNTAHRDLIAHTRTLLADTINQTYNQVADVITTLQLLATEKNRSDIAASLPTVAKLQDTLAAVSTATSVNAVENHLADAYEAALHVARETPVASIASIAWQISDTIETARSSAAQLGGTDHLIAQGVQFQRRSTDGQAHQQSQSQARSEIHAQTQELIAQLKSHLADAQANLDVARTDLERSGATGAPYEKADNHISVAASVLTEAGTHLKNASDELNIATSQPSSQQQTSTRMPTTTHDLHEAISAITNTLAMQKIGGAMESALTAVECANKAIYCTNEHLQHHHAHRSIQPAQQSQRQATGPAAQVELTQAQALEM